MVKIKSKSEPWNIYHNGNEVEEYLKEHILSDEHIIDDDNEIYVRKSDGHVFPLSHPDLSTQPSILHERFGTYRIYEVLIPVNSGDVQLISYDQIPASAVIMSVFAFNKDRQSAVNTRRAYSGWEFSVVGSFVPDFLLVKYYDTERDTYYGSGEDYGDGYSEQEEDACWRRYEQTNETYLTNSVGQIVTIHFGDNYYALQLDTNYIPKLKEVYSWISMVESDWGRVDTTAYGDGTYLAFRLSPSTEYVVFPGISIEPQPTFY